MNIPYQGMASNNKEHLKGISGHEGTFEEELEKMNALA
jgi:hypothetical protein